MSRSKWKGPFINSSLLQIKNKPISSKNKKLIIWSRNSIIPGFLSNKSTLIYNGKYFKTVFINDNMVGFKFGEFSFTRSYSKKEFQKKATSKKTVKK